MTTISDEAQRPRRRDDVVSVAASWASGRASTPPSDLTIALNHRSTE